MACRIKTGHGGRGRPGNPPPASLAGLSVAAGGEVATYDDPHGGVHRTVSLSTPCPYWTGRWSTRGLYRAEDGTDRGPHHRHRLEDRGGRRRRGLRGRRGRDHRVDEDGDAGRGRGRWARLG